MKTKLGYWMMGYGLFLIVMGVAGYASNPEKARTALMSGGTFGALSILWGWLMTRGFAWSRWAAIGTTAFLAAIFGWRASVSWLAFTNGASDKLTAAVLITAMGAASVLMLVALVRGSAQAQLPRGEGRT
jgi:uncharacterized membrane protein (UPF0136 family)